MTTEQRGYNGIADGFDGSLRLDRYIAENLKLLSRSQIKTRALEAKVNGRSVKLSRQVKSGDSLELRWQNAAPLYLEAEDIPLDIIYEDSRCVVVNKAQGMVVHPGAGNHSGTLANALLWRHPRPREQPDYRSGIVHRLDKDTSGVIAAAYDDDALSFLAGQFRARSARKRYLALVCGTPQEREGRVITRLVRDPANRKRFAALPDIPANNAKGKLALTQYRVLKTWNSYSLLLLKPKTGRTHQLRVHLKYLGHPILGDPIYNPLYTEGKQARERQFPDATLMLHAASLAIVIPGETLPRLFKAPLPDRFKAVIGALNHHKG